MSELILGERMDLGEIEGGIELTGLLPEAQAVQNIPEQLQAVERSVQGWLKIIGIIYFSQLKNVKKNFNFLQYFL